MQCAVSAIWWALGDKHLRFDSQEAHAQALLHATYCLQYVSEPPILKRELGASQSLIDCARGEHTMKVTQKLLDTVSMAPHVLALSPRRIHSKQQVLREPPNTATRNKVLQPNGAAVGLFSPPRVPQLSVSPSQAPALDAQARSLCLGAPLKACFDLGGSP